MAHGAVILVTKETRPRSNASFKEMLQSFGDCLRVTHRIPERFEIKLGHFQKLSQELTKCLRNHLFKDTLFTRAAQCIVGIIASYLNNPHFASAVIVVE